MELDLYNLIGEYCITIEDGQKVYNLIYPQLADVHPVELDFAGVKGVATPFFNFAIGQLLKDLQPDELNRLLKFTNLNSVAAQVRKRVIENAKRYYSDEHFHNAVNEVLTSPSAEA